MSRRKRSNLGVSIVEVLIAIGILSIAGAGLFQRMVDTGRRGRLWERQAQRNLLAQKELEQLLACSHDALSHWTAPPDFEAVPDHPGYVRKLSVTRGDGNLLGLSVEVGLADASGRKPLEGNSIELAGSKAP